MLAVIKTGGKQYKVSSGDIIKIEKIAAKEDDAVVFDQVLFISDTDGKNIEIGTPILANRSVEGKVLQQGRSRKVRVLKYKPKTRYRKVYGHRQHFSSVKITKI